MLTQDSAFNSGGKTFNYNLKPLATIRRFINLELLHYEFHQQTIFKSERGK